MYPYIFQNHRDYTMSLDTYTRYLPLTQKAQFWGTYVSALKGGYLAMSKLVRHLLIILIIVVIPQELLTSALPLSPA